MEQGPRVHSSPGDRYDRSRVIRRAPRTLRSECSDALCSPFSGARVPPPRSLRSPSRSVAAHVQPTARGRGRRRRCGRCDRCRRRESNGLDRTRRDHRAVVGGAAGLIIGNQMDQQAKELKQTIAGATIERVGEGIQVTFASGLLYEFDSDQVLPAAATNLRSLASSLGKFPNTDLLIVGHTDAAGLERVQSIALAPARRRGFGLSGHAGRKRRSPSHGGTG